MKVTQCLACHLVGWSRRVDSEQHDSVSVTLLEEPVEGGGGGSEWHPPQRQINSDNPRHVQIDTRSVV